MLICIGSGDREDIFVVLVEFKPLFCLLHFSLGNNGREVMCQGYNVS